MGYLARALLQHAIRRCMAADEAPLATTHTRLLTLSRRQSHRNPPTGTLEGEHDGEGHAPPSILDKLLRARDGEKAPLLTSHGMTTLAWRAEPVAPEPVRGSLEGAGVPWPPPGGPSLSAPRPPSASSREKAHDVGDRSKAETADPDAGEYVPLLFRKDFMLSWHRPHAPLPREALARGGRPPPPPLQLSESGTGQQREGPPPLSNAGEALRASRVCSATEAVAAPALPDPSVLDQEPSAGSGGRGECAQPDTYTTVRLPASSRLILDPVQWLSESPDAPLMDSTTLLRHIGSAAHHLTFTESTHQLHAEEDDVGAGEASPPPPAADKGGGQGRLAAAAREAQGGWPQGSPAHVYVSIETPDGEAERAAASARAHAADGVAGEVDATAGQHPSVTGGRRRRTTRDLLPCDSAQRDRLVYNVFTRRIAKEQSAGIQALALLGIHVDPNSRQLSLTDEEAFNRFVHQLRSNAIAWPTQWAHSAQHRVLERILRDATLPDPAERVRRLLASQYKKLRGRHHAGVVGSNDADADSGSGGTPEAQSGDAAAVERVFALADLNEEQRKVVQLVLQGHNLYIGGSAGTGKTVLLSVVKRELRERGLKVAVTATTGVASTLIGGTTLHSRFGINIRGEFTRPAQLTEYDVVIIDEVSMLSRELLEALDWELRRAHGVALPFGGVQMILCGDFLQLSAVGTQPIVNAPVFRRNFVMLKLMIAVRQASSPVYVEQLRTLRRGEIPAGLDRTVNLLPPSDVVAAEGVERRRLGERQREMLHTILGDDEVGRLTSRVGGIGDGVPTEAAEGAETGAESETLTSVDAMAVEGAVNLLPTNAEVSAVNERELAKLPGEATVFPAQVLPPNVSGLWSPTYLLRLHTPSLLQSRQLSQSIEDFIAVYFRGTSLGDAWVQRGMSRTHTVMYPLFVDALALRVKLPTQLTPEEVLGFETYMAKHLDNHLAELNLGVRMRDVLLSAEGLQTERDDYLLDHYVAATPVSQPLSLKIGARVMLRANLTSTLVNGSIGTVVGFTELTLETLPRHFHSRHTSREATALYREFLTLEQGLPTALVPVVDFGSGRHDVIPPWIYTVGGLANTHHYATSIVALPLSLAYAFTVHKVQGLTLVGRVHLELSRMWPCEHLLYVAMSRVRNPEQLSISNFHPDLVLAAADCLAFDDALPSVENARVLAHFVPATWVRAPHRRKRVLQELAASRLARKERNAARKRQADRRKALDKEIRELQERLISQEPVAT